jgi:hypothetical protein
VAVQNGFAYMVARGYTLIVADVSNPVTPVELKVIEWTKAEACSSYSYEAKVEVFDSYVYMVDGCGVLHILDVSNPLEPALVESDQVSVKDIALADNYLYLMQSEHSYITNQSVTTLSVVASADPLALRQVGTYTNSLYSYNITLIDDQLYLPHAGGWSYTHGANYPLGYNLLVLDVSDPTRPVEVGAYDAATIINDVAAFENRVYMAGGPGDLRVVDLTDPAKPQEVEAYGLPGEARKVVADDNYIYVAGAPGGLFILDRSREN